MELYSLSEHRTKRSSHVDTYYWIIKVIESCNKKSQKKSISNLIDLFLQKYENHDNFLLIMIFYGELISIARKHFSKI